MANIHIKNLSLSYATAQGQNQSIFHALNLSVPAEQLLVLMGPSGCGKSSLLNLLAGYIQPNSGEVWVNQKLVSGPSSDRGVIFQKNTLLPWLNVIENVALALRIKGKSKRDALSEAEQCLSFVGLQQYAQHQLWEISGGMLQRVAIARALASDPEVLLLDEPFAALDAFSKEQMQELVLQLWHHTKKQIVLITHDVDEAIVMATQLVLLGPIAKGIEDILKLDFAKKIAQGSSITQIKSELAFSQTRAQVMQHFFRSRLEVSA